MSVFRDADHLYQVLDAFFQRLSAEPDIAEALLAGQFVLRFRYHDPEGQVTVDLRQAPITWVFGETELEPDLEMIQSADLAHQFWLGRVNIPRAIATRKVISRGPVTKALKLLPAIKPAYPIYEQVVRELGYQDMLPEEREERREKRKGLLGRLLSQLQRKVRGRLELDYPALNAHLIPLVDELPEREVSFRDQGLPQDELALKREMLCRMGLIRAFEDKLAQVNALGELPTEAVHLSIGQEASAVGVCFALRTDDYMVTTHRGHGHMLAKGADLNGMMAELFGKQTGLCGGKGGSMHVTDAAIGALGANGIVGASPLIAIGAAMSAKQRGSDQVAVAFMGDGATNQGMFHEALNFAAVFDLPVIFVVENNQYGEFTPLERHSRVSRLSDRAAAYGIPGATVDGNDVWAVYQATQGAVVRARRGNGPTLLECLTYRWHGHMEGEAVDYRPAEEVERWKEKCPIKRWHARLLAEGTLDESAAALESESASRVEAAYHFAVASPEPGREALTTDVYAPELRILYEPQPKEAAGREVTCSAALLEALAEEMERDERVYLLGEDVTAGGYFAVTAGLIEGFGPQRVIDTPISEYAIVGSAVGAAMTGRRPVAEILFSDFLTTCMDPLINQAAKLRYMSGGQYTLPLVVRSPGGAGLGMAAQHSQSLEALLTGVPGLIVIAPATPYDAKGLLKAAIRSNNPVLFFENKLLYTLTGPIPAEGVDYLVPIGVADVEREGHDVTLVSVGAALGLALEAAGELARQGIEVELIDPRTLVPLDLAAIARSTAKTGRLVTLEEGPLGHGFGSEVVARVVEAAWGALKAPPKRLGGLDVPIPYNHRLENAALPDVEQIVEAVLALL